MMDNLGSLDLDPSVRLAYEEAKDSKTIMPILKEELKLTILSRRFKSGKGEITLDDKKTPIKRELSEDEIMKKLRRKEQNRRAAERCRTKKKKVNDQLAIDYINEQRVNSKLATEIEALKREKEALQRVVEEHAFTCMRAVTPSPSYDEQTTFFNGSYTCPTPSIQQEMPAREPTPLTDPFDEYPVYQDQDFLYPVASNDTKPRYRTCTTSATEFPEIQLQADDFSDFPPVSPDMVLGRQSISDYLDDEDFLNH